VVIIAFVAGSNIGLAFGACPDGWIDMYDIMPELGCLLWERSCSQDLMSWERADAFCKENGAHLVEINSLFQMDMLYTLSGPDGLECYFWAGATDNDVEGEWRWQGSGELVPDEVWNSGFPRIGDTDSNCMHLDFRSFPSAEDMMCDYENAHYPICQMFI